MSKRIDGDPAGVIKLHLLPIDKLAIGIGKFEAAIVCSMSQEIRGTGVHTLRVRMENGQIKGPVIHTVEDHI